MKKILIILILASTFSCSNKEQADSIVINANIYTVNNNFDKAQPPRGRARFERPADRRYAGDRLRSRLL